MDTGHTGHTGYLIHDIYKSQSKERATIDITTICTCAYVIKFKAGIFKIFESYTFSILKILLF